MTFAESSLTYPSASSRAETAGFNGTSMQYAGTILQYSGMVGVIGKYSGFDDRSYVLESARKKIIPEWPKFEKF